jgi:hypothetical protein
MSQDMVKENGTFLQKVAIQLFTFMKMSGLKCSFTETPNEILSYTFGVTDLHEDGTPVGLDVKINSQAIAEVKDEPASIEEFCSSITRNVGHQIFNIKVDVLLKHKKENKIIL